jgi:predicted 3-demethylubiquinone-9 3-methyltransferase (glyoxalase superfamily)
MTKLIGGSMSRETMQKIIPYLWFNDKAEEAMNFYTSIV